MTTPDEFESFPRGGTFKPAKKRRHSEKNEKDLFRNRHEDDGAGIKKKKKNRHVTLEKKVAAKKRNDKASAALMKSNLSEPALLTSKSCSEGMLVLGVIKSVTNYHLDVSLPNGITGRVPITAISDTYTELLKRLAKDDFIVEAIRNLHELFRPGMLVRCKVTDVGKDAKGRVKLVLSLNPSNINRCLTPLALKNGMVVTGCVSSCEDHGYIIDLGVKGIYAFLKKAAADEYVQDYNDGKPLFVGSLLHCKVISEDKMEMMSGENRSIQLTINPREVFRSDVTKSMGVKMNTLLPGMRVEVSVKKTFDNGIAGDFLSYTGSIHRSHLNQNPAQLENGQKLKACVLYVHPVTKVAALTCLPHLLTPDLAPKKLFGSHQEGDLLKDVRVFKVEAKRGIYLKIDDQTLGFAGVSNLSDTEVKDIAHEYKKGTCVTCRIMDLSYCDKLVKVSLKKSILERVMLKFDEMTPGQDFEGEVKTLTKGGVSVQLSSNVRGFIPATHLADIPLKHPEKRFRSGRKIPCRVLSVNSKKKMVIMTAKKSILASKYPIITEYSQATQGMTIEGTATQITDKGVRILFYNDITGFVPKEYLGDEPIVDPSKAFYVGQVIRGKVLKSIPQKKKLIISLKTDEKPMKTTQETAASSAYLEVGQIVNVVVRNRTARGFIVGIKDTETTAFLPTEHLSNYLSNAKYLAELYKTGDTIENVMVFNISKQIILTRKSHLIGAANDEVLVKQFKELQPGTNVPGVVLNHKDYGVFVELPNGLIGLAPHKYICDSHIANATELHQIGQSVIGKVTEVDQEKGRFLLSLRLKDCYHGILTEGFSLLADYLDEMDYIMEKYSQRENTAALVSHKIGEIVDVTVTKVTSKGILCTLPDGTKGVATEDHIREVKCEKGSTFAALVLYVDIEAECVEVSLNMSLIRNVRNLADSKFTKARVGQNIKSEVLLIKENFVLVALKGHSLGRLAYLPAKLHLNDMLERQQYEVTQENAVIIKRLEGDRVIASLQLHEPEEKKQDFEMGHNLQPGTLVTARVKQVLQFQLNISVGSISGRVHISEISKTVKEGKTPLDKFEKDQMLRVKVIGYRERKTNKHLPVTHSKIYKALPECTLVPKKIKGEGLSKNEDVHKSSFSVGDKVTVYIERFADDILWVQVSPKFRGKIKKSQISDDESIRTSPLNHFLVGKGYTAYVIGEPKANVLPLSLKGKLPVKRVLMNEEVREGLTLPGSVVKSGETGLIVRLSPEHCGRVASTDISDEYTVKPWKDYAENDEVTVFVINADHPKKCVLSMRDSRVETTKQKTQKMVDPELEIEDLVEGKVVRGYINKACKNNAFVTLGREIAGRFDKKREQKLTEGQLVQCKIIKYDEEKKMTRLKLIKADDSDEDDSDEDDEENNSMDVGKARKRKVSEDGSDVGSPQALSPRSPKKYKKDEDAEITDPQEPGISAGSAPRLSLTAGFTWDSELSLPKSLDPMILESDSDEDEDGKTDKPSSRKTRQERLAAQREEERRLVEKEQRLMDGDLMPESAEEFDRLVLQSPDSSLVWLRYMAFHLETTEIEKARAVAERALKTISFREEQEKLNVWVAYMNLENMYGTTDTLKVVFDRAVQHNEPMKVYNQLVKIYEKSEKEEAAELLYNTMIRKFSASKDVWINFGVFYFKHSKAKSAQKLMQRGLNSLDAKDHVEVLSKFAQMEFKYGEPERGKTMFENILSSYPKRTDLWSVYIDLIVKQGDMQPVRNLFERVVSQNFSAKKMKFFFKKQLDFEQKYGTDETVAAVKQKAVAYVEARESFT